MTNTELTIIVAGIIFHLFLLTAGWIYYTSALLKRVNYLLRKEQERTDAL